MYFSSRGTQSSIILMQYSPLILSGGINGRHTERQHRVSKEIEKEHMSADIDPKWGAETSRDCGKRQYPI